MARPRIGLVPLPIEHDGVHYPSRKALAQHLAATIDGCSETWSGRLQRAATTWRWRLRRRAVDRLTDGEKTARRRIRRRSEAHGEPSPIERRAE